MTQLVTQHPLVLQPLVGIGFPHKVQSHHNTGFGSSVAKAAGE